ncbi:protein SIEVE ELEMENT OCCLUSION B isoform X1 [Eucalyptus grandis]|uniref:protein SIEVE ELEMENT OCCLUSION B isoform X1 n=1 Tax=Eucalyptus grandis TaxID=71139 RepID=UPI00192E8C87|nr:protein SIEVE ELEMENT OCCLUSION B isoform X1 [Eucalyptus grandis]
MASKTLGQILRRERSKVDQSMLNSLLAIFDDEKFMKEMVDTHAPDEGDVDVQSLFLLVDNALRGTATIADSVINPKGTQGSGGPAFKPPKEGFNPPLAAINEVACEITCKALDTKNVRETMISIFHELSSYSWVNKAVITLSSLALFYGDFWRLAQIQPSDKLAESLAILKGLPAITKPSDVQKIQVYGVLNEMIKTTLSMTECIVEFEHDSKDVPELSTAIDIPSSVYQIIIGVLACSIQFTGLISLIDDYKGKDLLTFVRKVNMIHHTIKRHYEDYKQKKEEIREYQRLQRLFNAPTDNVELIKALVYIKDDPQPLYIGSKKTTDKVESLRRKNVMLLISDLKLTSHDLSILIKIYSERKFHEERYEIVWIPIIEQEGDDVNNQFKNLQSQMPWYSVRYPTLINKVAIKIIREKWHYRQETIVTVLGPQGRVSNKNAMSMIRLWGWDAFPFTESVGASLWSKPGISWFELLLTDMVIPKINEAIKSRKYILLYGAEDNKAIHEIEEPVKKIIEDGVPIAAYNVTKISSSGAASRALCSRNCKPKRMCTNPSCRTSSASTPTSRRMVGSRSSRGVAGCDQRLDNRRHQGLVPVRDHLEEAGQREREDVRRGLQGAPRAGLRPSEVPPLLHPEHGGLHPGGREVSGLSPHDEEHCQV